MEIESQPNPVPLGDVKELLESDKEKAGIHHK